MRLAWTIFIAVLALTVAAQAFVQRHEAFEVERVFAWNALYGFLACAALVLVAKALGLLLKRRDDYYDND